MKTQDRLSKVSGLIWREAESSERENALALADELLALVNPNGKTWQENSFALAKMLLIVMVGNVRLAEAYRKLCGSSPDEAANYARQFEIHGHGILGALKSRLIASMNDGPRPVPGV